MRMRLMIVGVVLAIVLALVGVCARPLMVAAAPVTSIFTCGDVTDIPTGECNALVDLFNSTNGLGWTDRTNWLTGPTVCDTWRGVGCDIEADGQKHVVIIQLTHNNLVGTIPGTLGNLPYLQALYLDFNSLSGSIPAGLGNLHELRLLALNNNQLSGSIPPELGSLLKLNYLYLSNNQLTGQIPGELGNLVYLFCLDLGYNRLSGPVPASLGNLTSLRRLCLDNNPDLSGPLPSTLTNLKLDYFSYNNTGVCAPSDPAFQAWLQSIPKVVGNGRICGNPPPPGFNCSAVRDVTLQECQALVALYTSTGGSSWRTKTNWLTANTVCTWYGVSCSLGHVRGLTLTNNGLQGTLPSELGNLTSMQTLYLNNNAGLTGSLPSTLTSVPLTTFSYAGTGLCAPAGAAFQNWLRTVRTVSGTGLTCGVTYTVTVNTPTVSPEPSRALAFVNVSARFTDTTPQGGPYTCTVDFGDGTTVNGSISGTTCYAYFHQYRSAGSYPVTVQVTNRLGTAGHATKVHRVN